MKELTRGCDSSKGCILGELNSYSNLIDFFSMPPPAFSGKGSPIELYRLVGGSLKGWRERLLSCDCKDLLIAPYCDIFIFDFYINYKYKVYLPLISGFPQRTTNFPLFFLSDVFFSSPIILG
jgi:hypothetical protein